MNIALKNIDLLSLILAMVVCVTFFKLFSNVVDAVFPALFCLLSGAALVFYLRFTKLNRIIVGVFVLYYLVTLHLPFIYIVINYTPLQIQEFMTFRGVSYDDYLKTSVYVFVFDLLLITFLAMFEIFIKEISTKKAGSSYKSGYIFYNSNKEVLLIFLFAFSVLAKLYLMYVGVWFFYEMNHLDTSGYKFLSYAYIIEKLDFVVLIYILYKYKINKASKFDMVLFLFITCLSLFFAFFSTSKAKMIMTLLPTLILLIFFYKNKKVSYLLVFISLLVVQPFFSYMTALRHTGGDIDQVEMFKKDTESILDNKALARLDYQTVLSKVLLTYPAFPDEFESKYLNNLMGLIPRAIWPTKPVIGLDTNKIGYEIGFLAYQDNVTSVGITPIGIAYYFFGYAGVFVIAFFISILIASFSCVLKVNSWLGFFLSLMVSIELARNGTYVNILPSLAQIVIVFTIVGILLNNDELRDDFKEK